VSIDGVVDQRAGEWGRVLSDWGLELEDPPRPSRQPNQLSIFARTSDDSGPLGFSLTISELWVAGSDPDGLNGTSLSRCHIRQSSWHVQFHETKWTSTDLAGERLDLDRSKPRSLIIHRHPLGQANGTREQVSSFPAPAAWLGHVFELWARISDLEQIP
jgi:hypothetical protein